MELVLMVGLVVFESAGRPSNARGSCPPPPLLLYIELGHTIAPVVGGLDLQYLFRTIFFFYPDMYTYKYMRGWLCFSKKGLVCDLVIYFVIFRSLCVCVCIFFTNLTVSSQAGAVCVSVLSAGVCFRSVFFFAVDEKSGSGGVRSTWIARSRTYVWACHCLSAKIWTKRKRGALNV